MRLNQELYGEVFKGVRQQGPCEPLAKGGGPRSALAGMQRKRGVALEQARGQLGGNRELGCPDSDIYPCKTGIAALLDDYEGKGVRGY